MTLVRDRDVLVGFTVQMNVWGKLDSSFITADPATGLEADSTMSQGVD